MHSHPSKNNVNVMKDRQDMGTILHKDFKTNCKEKNYEKIKNALLLLSFKKNVNTEREREREREERGKQNKYEHYSNRFQKLISLLYNSILSRFNKCQIINKISIPKKKN